MTAARQTLDQAVTEKAFMATVVEMAQRLGWMPYHTHDSRRSEPGFPDLVLCRPPRLIFAECKTERGRLTSAQAGWITALHNCSGVDAYVWRPSDLDQIEAALR